MVGAPTAWLAVRLNAEGKFALFFEQAAGGSCRSRLRRGRSGALEQTGVVDEAARQAISRAADLLALPYFDRPDEFAGRHQ